jgi:hypothetical protein
MPQKTIVTALALGALLTGTLALAQTPSTGSTSSPQAGTPAFKPLPVIFPISELGGCGSKEACRVYCDIDTNHDACFAYAQTHGIMRADEIQKAREFLKAHSASSTAPRPGPRSPNASIDAVLATQGGPGGCTTREACKTYCDEQANADGCLKFAQAHNLMSADQISMARKLQAQIGPGGCKGAQCKEYCADSEHEQVCVAFAQQNGFISKDDAEQRMQRMQLASTTRPMPPIPVNRDGKIGSSTMPKPDMRPANAVFGTSTRPDGFENIKKPPPPKPAAGASSDQGGSVFMSILRFLGI